MIMDIRIRFYTFRGLILCLFCIFQIQESGARVETINVVEKCKVSSIVTLKYPYSATLKAEEYGPLYCKILIDTKSTNSVVVAFYEYSIGKHEKLAFHDNDGSRLYLSGRGKYYSEERSFILKGPVTVYYVTSTDRISSEKAKFQFVYTVVRGSLGTFFNCTKDEFQCSNGLCLPGHLVCDNHNSCGDGSDEKDCTTTCAKDEFRCANRKCIPYFNICDKTNDCGDSSDEADCNHLCTSEEYKCLNSHCISKRQVCDNHNDCGDWSDEIDCSFECFGNHFLCYNHKCIEGKLVCNGHDDCGDNTDEHDCNRWCYPDEFQCVNNKCISKYQVCNRRNDCGDLSDEENCRVTYWPPLTTKKPDVTVVELRNPWLITIIVAAAILAIIVVTFSAVFIRGCVANKNKPAGIPTVSANIEVHQVPQPNILERIRQSFRSERQMSSPSPLQPPDQRQMKPQPVTGSQTYQVPSMYPQLQSGVENPEFRTEK